MILRRALLGILLALLLSGGARAQSGAPTSCSGTAGTSSAAITFPASGGHGPPRPQQYLMIENAHAAATIAVNVTGSAAVVNGSGSITLYTGGSVLWSSQMGTNPPSAVNIISDTSSTAFTCLYQ